MPDKPDIIEQCEDDVWRAVYVMRDNGISFQTTRQILQEILSSLDLMSYCERWVDNCQ